MSKKKLLNLKILPVYRFYFKSKNGYLETTKPKFFQFLPFDIVLINNITPFINFDNKYPYTIETYSNKNKLLLVYKTDINNGSKDFIDIPNFLNIGYFVIKNSKNEIVFKYDLSKYSLCNENGKCENYERFHCSKDCFIMKNPYYPFHLGYRDINFIHTSENTDQKCVSQSPCECLQKEVLDLMYKPEFLFKIKKIEEKFKIDPNILLEAIIRAESRCNPFHINKGASNLDLGLMQINSFFIHTQIPIVEECLKLLNKNYVINFPFHPKDEDQWGKNFVFKDIEVNFCISLHKLWIQGCEYETEDINEKILWIYLGYNRGKRFCDFLEKNKINIIDYCEKEWNFQGVNILSCLKEVLNKRNK